MNKLKVIVRRKTGEVIRGFLQAPPDLAPGQYPSTLPDSITLQVEGSSETTTIEVASLKAVFFVKRFTGDPKYREVKFFSEAPLSEDLWVRLRFFDKEILEGTVHNGLETFLQPGFLFRPADCASNNEALYVIKSSLVQMQILRVADIMNPRTVPDLENAGVR